MKKCENIIDSIWNIFWNVYLIWACLGLSATIILDSFEIEIPHFWQFQLSILMLSTFIYAFKCKIISEIKGTLKENKL